MIYFWIFLGLCIVWYSYLRKRLRRYERQIRGRPTSLDRFAAQNLREQQRSDRQADQQ